ncbi:6725_t:CDS:2 [Funneliformis geosporum]|uniref:6725_t:CDS:1 n=1 Tax=Funneliformis geosporum TaxID=1117311 RepID=A0A9W4WU65_9GLOM|nr:6725_t:CDS:2 [Funneliformis geosporum]
MVDIIIEVKKHLGISDDELNELTASADLAMPTKQVEGINTSLTLKETIKICNTLLPHLTPSRILDKLIDEANRYQALNVATNDIIREKGEIDKGKLEKLKNSQEKHTDYEAIKNELERPATGGSGTGTSSPVDKQKIADLIKVIEKQNQAIRKYGDAQDNFTGDYS